MSLVSDCTIIVYDTYPKINKLIIMIIIIIIIITIIICKLYITICQQLILCICPYAYAPCVFTILLLFVYASACVVEKRDFLLHYFLVLLRWTLTTESLFWLLKSGEPSDSVRCPGMRNFNKNKQINTNPCQQLIWKNMRLNVKSCIINTNLLKHLPNQPRPRLYNQIWWYKEE